MKTSQENVKKVKGKCKHCKKQIQGFWYNMDGDSSNASNPCREDVNEFHKIFSRPELYKR